MIHSFRRRLYCIIILLCFLLILPLTFLLLLTFLPNLPPKGVEFRGLMKPTDITFEGNLEPNENLTNAEILSEEALNASIGYFKVRSLLSFNLATKVFPL